MISFKYKYIPRKTPNKLIVGMTFNDFIKEDISISGYDLIYYVVDDILNEFSNVEIEYERQ